MSEHSISPLQKNLTAFLLLLFLTPFAHFLSPTLFIAGQQVYLCYLPYGLAVAAIYIFGRAATAPLCLAFFITFRLLFAASLPALAFTLALLTPILVCSWLARRWLGRRWRYNPGHQGIGVRLCLINTLAPLFTLLLLTLFAPAVGSLPGTLDGYFSLEWNMFSVLRLQNLALSAVLFTIFFYFPLRMLAHPRYARTFCRLCWRSLSAKGNRLRALLWWGLIILLLALFCSSFHYWFISSYLVPLVFVLFTWGIMRFTSQLVIWLWSASCLLLMHYNFDVLPIGSIFSVTFLSSALIAFTISLLYIAASYWHSRRLQQTALSLSLSDPIVHRPNLRALAKKLKRQQSGVLCYLYLHQLKLLGCHYGLLMHTYSKRCIIDEIATQLRAGEGVYQITGDGLMLLLQGDDLLERLTQLRARLKKRQIVWHNQPIDIDYAFAAGRFTAEGANLYHLAAQLSYLAEQSLLSGGVTLLDSDNAHLIGEFTERVVLLQKIKQALAQRDISLFAQPIVACQGERRYYEVLARLRSDDALIMPDRFMPLIAEFHLSVAFDKLVVEETAAFIHRRRQAKCPLPCMAINLLPATLTEPGIARILVAIFRRFDLPTETVIFEITEAQALMDNPLADAAIAALRQAGFRIAIDDFGTGFANYERVKRLSADIIKIDGLFVKNSLNDKLDRIIIKSICDIAREKGVSVVAEYVETEAQRALLGSLGVDYIQGWLTGQPAPFDALP
ncbi:sensor domain-containing phosphodiesterase [Mixta calida]|uniref:sensor domain-containing phosphodiesterase n=1 Tax=Mixta calida TaxID=665913 RepID=UPI00289796D3|nr:EAL domain-containing protein [Mixta calida]